MTQRDLERLTGVHHDLSHRLTFVYEEMVKLGFVMFVVEGVRTNERQAYLYSLGRSRPGQIVTYKDGERFRSNHQPHPDGMGYAVDSAFTPKEIKDPFSHRWPWEKFGELVESTGLLWGGRWKMVDLPHSELTGKSPSTP